MRPWSLRVKMTALVVGLVTGGVRYRAPFMNGLPSAP